MYSFFEEHSHKDAMLGFTEKQASLDLPQDFVLVTIHLKKWKKEKKCRFETEVFSFIILFNFSLQLLIKPH